MKKTSIILLLILSSCGGSKVITQQLGTIKPETSLDLIQHEDEVILESMPRWKYKFKSRIELKKHKVDVKAETKQKKNQGKVDIKINKSNDKAEVKITQSNDKAEVKITKSNDKSNTQINKDIEKYKAKIKKYESKKNWWWLWLLVGISLPYIIKFIIKIVK